MTVGEDQGRSLGNFSLLVGFVVFTWMLVVVLSLWMVRRQMEHRPDWMGTKDALNSYAGTIAFELENALMVLETLSRQPYFRSKERKENFTFPRALATANQDFSDLAIYTPDGERLETVIGSPKERVELRGVIADQPELQLDESGDIMLMHYCKFHGEPAVVVGWREFVANNEHCQLLVGAQPPPAGDRSVIEIPVAFANPMTDARLRWTGAGPAAASSSALIWVPLILFPLLVVPLILLGRHRHREREIEALQIRLAKSEMLSQSAHQDRERIEMVRKISGGIAHDFKNFLTTILGNLSLLEDANESDRSELVNDATDAAMVASELAHQLMAMSDQVEINPRLWRATHLARNAERLIRQVLPFDIQVELALAGDLWSVMADSTHMGRVFHNLMINAIHAMPEGGTIRFSARNVPGGAAGSEAGGDMVEFEILDEGVGMAPEIIQRIFEPYFSTKGKESGKINGLGLYNASTILQEHGGIIECNSEVGKGTSFRVTVPRAAEVAKVESPEASESLRLLVVDDEEIFRSLTMDLLTRYGYTVVTARDGKEAVDVASQSLEPFDLILLDLKMPVLSGTKVFRLLRERGVKTPVVVCTGFPEQAQNFEAETGQAPDGVVLKPFDFEVLVSTVERVLQDDSRIHHS